MGMSQFYLVGTNYLLKKMYLTKDGEWTPDKAKAKLFSVSEMNPGVRKKGASADIMNIKVEWAN